MIRCYYFSDAYRLLVDEYSLSVDQAFGITLRVFRGGGLAKDAVYLRGLINTLKYLQQRGDLKLLFIGKIHQNHIPLIKELLNREVLKEHILTNHYHTDEFQERLKKASRKDFQLTDMV